MLKVNNSEYQFHEGISLTEIMEDLGFTGKAQRIAVRVDGKSVPRAGRKDFEIHDGMDIKIIRALIGG